MSDDYPRIPDLPPEGAGPQAWRDHDRQMFESLQDEMRFIGNGLGMTYQPPGEPYRLVTLHEYVAPGRWLVNDEDGEMLVVESRWLANPRS